MHATLAAWYNIQITKGVRMAIKESLAQVFRDTPPDARDLPLAELALVYAGQIDEYPETNTEILGPKLLQALDALGLTPKARRIVGKGPSSSEQPADELGALRIRTAARKNPA